MNETIRQHIKRRVRWCMAIAAGGWLMFPLATSLGGYLPEGIPQGAAPLAGMLLFVGAILTMQRIVKCPKSGSDSRPHPPGLNWRRAAPEP